MAAKNCLAVEGYQNSTADPRAANGRALEQDGLVLLTVPAPSGTTAAYLYAVACTTASNC